MKQVINGKVYNTETAKEIESRSYSHVGDFRHYEEALYKTKKGQLFIAGSGGPMSHYSESVAQNEWSGGSKLRLVSENQARDFLEKCSCDESYYNAAGLGVEEG